MDGYPAYGRTDAKKGTAASADFEIIFSRRGCSFLFKNLSYDKKFFFSSCLYILKIKLQCISAFNVNELFLIIL